MSSPLSRPKASGKQGDGVVLTAGFIVDGSRPGSSSTAAGRIGEQPKKKLSATRPMHAAGTKAHIWLDGRLTKSGHPLELQTVTESLPARMELGHDRSMEVASRDAIAPEKRSRYSAGSRVQLLQYGDRSKENTGHIQIKENAIYNDGDGEVRDATGAKGAALKAMRTQQALERVRKEALKQGSYFIVLIKRHVQTNNVCTRADFTEFLDLLHVGLSNQLKAALLNHYYDYAKGGMNAEKFVQDLGGEKFLNEVRKNQPHADPADALEAPQHMPEKNDYQDATGAGNSKIVFFAGLLVCPIWCIACVWINSKRPSARRYARISICLSILVFLGAVVGVAIYFERSAQASRMGNCPQFHAVLLRLRLAGTSANLMAMAGKSRQDYDSQFNFKRPLFSKVLYVVSFT
jgi:hypothetical protein